VWLLKIRGIETPEEAENLKGQVLMMPAGERPQLDSDEEFYAQELVGMQVWISATLHLRYLPLVVCAFCMCNPSLSRDLARRLCFAGHNALVRRHSWHRG
jgi:hypothetical protein